MYQPSKYIEYRPNVYILPDKPTGAETLKTSEVTPGIWRLTNYSVSHQLGNQPLTIYLHEPEIKAIESARTLAASVTGRYDHGWTYPKIARELCEWLDLRQPPVKTALELIPPTWHYQRCEPYECSNAYLYDLTSAYWQIIERCHSPLFTIARDRICWQSLGRLQQSRWDTLRSAFASGEAKKLRLSLVGVNAAGWKKPDPGAKPVNVCAWCRGKPYVDNGISAGLQAVAIMAVRCIYEVTQLQAESSDAIYSNADNVIQENPGVDVWNTLGLKYVLQSTGPTFVNHVGAYKVGEYQTELFRADTRLVNATKARRIVNFWYDKVLYNT